jgi:hypothetical protein
MTSEAANLFPIYESQVPSFQMPDINNDLGRDFVFETFSQSSQIFSHEKVTRAKSCEICKTSILE